MLQNRNEYNGIKFLLFQRQKGMGTALDSLTLGDMDYIMKA